MSDVVEFSIADSIATVRLNRPEKLNAVSWEMRVRLFEIIEQVEDDPAIRVTILTGSGDRAFCAGADLTEMSRGSAKRPSALGGFAGFVRHDRAKPVIAAVNGLAYGGGFEIVLACDMAVACERAVFALPEVRRGILAGGGGALRLSRMLPPALARELLLTGSSMSAAEALRWGLVNRVVPAAQLSETAAELAGSVCAGAPLAVTAALEVSRAVDRLMDGAGWPASDQALARVRQSVDAREGPRAFAERREPKWTGT